jgi:hypothetical protein
VLGGGGLLRHPSSASACGRRSRLGNFRMSSGAGGSSSNKEFQIQTVEGEEEVRGLALLCLESFYGKHRPVDYLNPIGALQRSLVFEQVVEDLSMRVRRYKVGGTPHKTQANSTKGRNVKASSFVAACKEMTPEPRTTRLGALLARYAVRAYVHSTWRLVNLLGLWTSA